MALLFNYLHLFIVMIPFLLYLRVPEIGSRLYYTYIFIILMMMLVPLHWVFFDDQCIFTTVSKKLGDYKQTGTTSAFSETNLKWIYKPIMDFFGWEWNTQGLDKMVNLHWMINFVLIWYYIFFRLHKRNSIKNL